jgi:hypothetical protein
LQAAHWASGFRPRQIPELHNDLIDPAEMLVRGFHFWRQTRWPGRNGRVRYAHTLFNLYVIRCLELLSMRLWDGGADGAGERLAQVQAVLDELWRSTPVDLPVLVRDARWLIPLAQSPTTDELAAYFEVARQIAETLPAEDSIEIQTAHVRMIGGHLRSQMRHYCTRDGVSLDENSVVLRTRMSNALDFALLVQNFVPLLAAYERAVQAGDSRSRLELAGAVCQGISPDPELFLNRVDLLAAYSMIETLFIATDRDGQAAYTPMGRRHVQLFREYEALISRVSKALYDDCRHFRPVEGAYSPYGIIYGTPTNLMEDMALKTLQRDAVTRFGLEDVFADGAPDPDKLAWVRGWRQLPHVDPDVQRLYDYPQQFAEDIFGRIEHALCRAVSDDAPDGVFRTGRLTIVSEKGPQSETDALSEKDPQSETDALSEKDPQSETDALSEKDPQSETDPLSEKDRLSDKDPLSELGPPPDANASPVPDLPIRHVGSSDPQIVAAGKAHDYDRTKLLRDRQEGYFLVSFETSGGWVAIKKDILTAVLGAGHDAKIAGLPPAAARVLRLMCADLGAPDEAR